MSWPRHTRLWLLIWLLAAPLLLFPTAVPELTALALLLLLYPYWLARRTGGRFLPEDPLAPFVLAYLLLVLLAFTISPLPLVSLPKLTVAYLGASAYFLALTLLADERGITGLAALLAAAGGAVALSAPFMVAWPDRQVIDLRFLIDYIPHLTGSFEVHANEIAGTLVFLLPLAAYFLWHAGSSHGRRLFGLALTLLTLLLLALMQSRAAFLALFVIIVAVPTWSRFRLRYLGTALVTITCLLLLVLFVLDVTPAEISDLALELDTVSKQGALAPRSWPMRAEIWRAAGRMLWSDYPAMGAGLNTFVEVSRANYAYRYVPPYLTVAHAHNLWLQSGADAGWPGVVAITLLLAVPLAGLWLVARTRHLPAANTADSSAGPTPHVPLAHAFGISLLAYVVFNLFDVVSPVQRPGVLFWLVLAGAAALLRIRPVLSRPVRALAALPLLLLVVLLLSPAGQRNQLNLAWDHARLNDDSAATAAIDVSQLDLRRQAIAAYLRGDREQARELFGEDPQGVGYLESQGRLAHHAGELEAALDWYGLALELNPAEASVLFWRGQTYEQLDQPQLALADFSRAAAYAPLLGMNDSWQAATLYNMARQQAQLEQWDEAMDSVQQAIALDSSEPVFHLLLGDLLQTLGDEAGASAAYERARIMSGN